MDPTYFKIIDPIFVEGVVLVTGAGSGIGRQIAQDFGRNGVKRLFLVDLSIPSLQETKALLSKDGGSVKVELFEADIADEGSVSAMVTRCVEVFGRLDVAVNNAGRGVRNMKTAEVAVEDFDNVCAVNLYGTYLCEKYEIEQMLKQESIARVQGHGLQRGSIINISSMAGNRPLPEVSSYNASKHSVVGLSRFVAKKYARQGIRVNTVSPGPTWTPMIKNSGIPQEYIDAGTGLSPMQRWYEVSEIASAVLFLAGTGASGITGMDLRVDGGGHLNGTLY